MTTFILASVVEQDQILISGRIEDALVVTRIAQGEDALSHSYGWWRARISKKAPETLSAKFTLDEING